MIYELINPSDPVTIQAEDDKVAAAVALIVGKGAMGLFRTDGYGNGIQVLPIMIFCDKSQLDEYLRELGIHDMSKFIVEKINEIIDCLESALVGSASDRVAIMEVCSQQGDVKKAMRVWNESKRTSMNDICGACHGFANEFRKNMGRGA